MSTTIADTVRPLAATRVAIAVVVLGVIGLLLLFRQEAAAAFGVWRASTAYNHCFLVAPIAAWLVWDRRAALAGLRPRPWPLALLLALPLGLAWLAAERVGIMEGRQLAAIGFVELLFLAVLGRELFRALCGPLLYLVLLVPFGAFVTPSLQQFTAHFVTHGLDLFGIRNYSDGNVIEIPEGTFFVAEACAGLRFLIASIAFGALYALVMYRSFWRRVAFIAVSAVVPVFANGLRALGIVSLGHVLGSADAAATDHVLYGWLFFSIVTIGLVLAGRPFRQDGPAVARPPALPPAERAGSLPGFALVAAAVLLLASVTPALAAGLDTMAVGALPAPPALADSSCRALAPAREEKPPADVPARNSRQDFDCGGTPVSVFTEVLSPRVGASVLVAERRRILGPPDDDEGGDTGTLRAGRVGRGLVQWDVVRGGGAVTAVALWIDGLPGGGIRSRVGQAVGSLLGDARAPLLIAVRTASGGSPGPVEGSAAARTITTLLRGAALPHG
jgi:exosortase A